MNKMSWIALSAIGMMSMAGTVVSAHANPLDHNPGWPGVGHGDGPGMRRGGGYDGQGFGQAEHIARKAERLVMLIRSNPELGDMRLQRIDNLLDRAIALAGGQPMPEPGPQPQPVPGPIQPPNRPQCVLQGAGTYNYLRYNFLISVGGNVLDGENDLTSALSKIDTLRSAGVCSSVPSFENTCGLQGTGTYNYLRYNFQVQLNGSTIQGENDLSSTLSDINLLTQHGMCRVRPEGACTLGGAGVYNYLRYNYLLNIGQNPVDGNDDMGAILNEMTQLRNAGICN